MVDAALAFLLSVSVQASHPRPVQHSPNENTRFTYVLPEAFTGWACVDFGVVGAPPLKLRDDGSYQIQPAPSRIIATSSFPNLRPTPWPNQVLQIVEGQPRPADASRRFVASHFEEMDTKSPVSRHCFFFGTAEEAKAVRRPPTLYESSMAPSAEIPEKFQFVRGVLCDFRDSSRLCVQAARSVRREILGSAMAAGLRLDPGSVGQRCNSAFDGVHVNYETLKSYGTPSRQPFGSAEVRQESAKRNVAFVLWRDSDGGTAKEIAARFGNELAEFFAKAGTTECGR